MSETPRIELAPGLIYRPGFLDRDAQLAMLTDILAVIAEAPLFQPVMPRTGTPFSVAMSNCGPLGWVSDRSGYRYQPLHPVTGQAWPAMPAAVVATWRALADCPDDPEACLVNIYRGSARMGLHQDRDEATFAAPVVSVSLGDTCIFRYGGTDRRSPTKSLKLASGDALILGGPSRLAFHGVDRIVAGSSTLVPDGGRINLTLRRVTG